MICLSTLSNSRLKSDLFSIEHIVLWTAVEKMVKALDKDVTSQDDCLDPLMLSLQVLALENGNIYDLNSSPISLN